MYFSKIVQIAWLICWRNSEFRNKSKLERFHPRLKASWNQKLVQEMISIWYWSTIKSIATSIIRKNTSLYVHSMMNPNAIHYHPYLAQDLIILSIFSKEKDRSSILGDLLILAKLYWKIPKKYKNIREIFMNKDVPWTYSITILNTVLNVAEPI